MADKRFKQRIWTLGLAVLTLCIAPAQADDEYWPEVDDAKVQVEIDDWPGIEPLQDGPPGQLNQYQDPNDQFYEENAPLPGSVSAPASLPNSGNNRTTFHAEEDRYATDFRSVDPQSLETAPSKRDRSIRDTTDTLAPRGKPNRIELIRSEPNNQFVDGVAEASVLPTSSKDTPERWNVIETDCAPMVVLKNQIDQSAQHIRIRAANGTFVHAAISVDLTRIIEELQTSVPVRADKKGLQLMARVVFPHVKDPDFNRPASVLIRGQSLRVTDQWQELRIGHMPTLVSRAIRSLRARLGSQIDVSDPYLDTLVLNIFGGPGETNVWIGEPKLKGQVVVDGVRRMKLGKKNGTTNNEQLVRIEGNILMVEGKPFLPRVINYNGEPLQFLQQLGFNTIQVDALPSPDILAEAQKQGMWIVAPPPSSNRDSFADQPILSWYLGDSFGDQELPELREAARALRSFSDRPLICSASSRIRDYSRVVDMMCFRKSPLGTSLDSPSYVAWLQQQARQTTQGIPYWASIQTEPNPAVEQQMLALFNSSAASQQLQATNFSLPVHELRDLVYAAVASGTRGLIFQSDRRLDGNDRTSRRRAATLQLLNAELDVLEPWVIAGDTSLDMRNAIAELALPHSQLLLPLATSEAGTTARQMTIAGAQDAADVYAITSTGLRPLAHQRVAGGIQFDLAGSTPVVVSRDQNVLRHLRRATAGNNVVTIRTAILESELQSATNVVSKLGGTSNYSESLAQIQADISRATRAIKTGDINAASQAVTRGERLLENVRNTLWNRSIAGVVTPVASPFCVHFEALPFHFALAKQLGESRVGGNVMRGGEFEDLQQMIRLGWRQYRRPSQTVSSEVALSPNSPKRGKYCLQLTSSGNSTNSQNPTAWVVSEPVNVRQGQIVRVSGSVRIDRPIRDTTDGLMIFDSLSGKPLSHRILQTEGWQDFTIYRVVDRDRSMRVTFSLNGIGTADIDNVRFQFLLPSSGTELSNRRRVDR